MTTLTIEYETKVGDKVEHEIDTSMEQLFINGNLLTSIDLSNLTECQNLKTIDLTANWLETVDLSP
ncbi:MAG: leucine-rich repeat domain-containing protein, partial [Candidatus Thorarchaeota archaeon]